MGRFATDIATDTRELSYECLRARRAERKMKMMAIPIAVKITKDYIGQNFARLRRDYLVIVGCLVLILMAHLLKRANSPISGAFLVTVFFIYGVLIWGFIIGLVLLTFSFFRARFLLRAAAAGKSLSVEEYVKSEEYVKMGKLQLRDDFP